MKDLKELCGMRYSVRAYLPQAVEKKKVEYILDCAILSPSSCNYQPWLFCVVTDEKVKLGIQLSYDRDWFKTAPLYIVVCKDATQSWKRASSDNKDFGDIDAAIAAQTICLAAAEQGLGTCWVCNFSPNMLRDTLALPQNIEPIAIFPLGYIDEENIRIPEKKRESIDEVVRWI